MVFFSLIYISFRLGREKKNRCVLFFLRNKTHLFFFFEKNRCVLFFFRFLFPLWVKPVKKSQIFSV